MDYRDKKITIMGLGLYPKGSGISATRFLHKRGAILTVTDLKTEKELKSQIAKLRGLKNISFVLGRHRKMDFVQADMVVQNPGVPNTSSYIKLARRKKIPIYSDISLFLEENTSPVIGITGTRGKSTTASLLHYILLSRYSGSLLGGNIQISPLTFLGKTKKDQPVVLELSSWQLNSLKMVKKSPEMAIVTNIMPDHLNRYSSMLAYIRDKKNIYKYQRECDVLILNRDNNETRKMCSESMSDVYWFSMKELPKSKNGVYVNNRGDIIFKKLNKKFRVASVSDISLLGSHNIYNALAAICGGVLSGVSNKKITRALSVFKGIPYRLEKVRTVGGVMFYNDTTATTPDATIMALRSFDKPVILIAGGFDKNLDYRGLARTINRSINFLIVLSGTATEKLVKHIDFQKVEVIFVDSMKMAVDEAWQVSKKGDAIVLSPAAASFGMFRNEFDRGDAFNVAVKKLK